MNDDTAMATQVRGLASEQFCYLTTTGRNSGNPHTIEIWFAVPPGESKLYLLSGGGEKSDWVRNIAQNGEVQVRIGGTQLRGSARQIEGEEEEVQARKLIIAKYYNRDTVADTGWEATSLPIAIDIDAINTEA